MNPLLNLYRRFLQPIVRRKIKQIVLSELERLVLEVIKEKSAAGSVPIVAISTAIMAKSKEYSGTGQILDIVDRLKGLGLIRSKKLGQGFMEFESFELTPDGAAKLTSL